MFTGIVERVCKVAGIRSGPRAVRVEIELGDLLEGLANGASVAVNGACLTLTERRAAIGGFDVVPETWRVSNLGDLKPGAEVNVERALRVGDRLDGHFVQGHVDGIGVVDRLDRTGGEFGRSRPTTSFPTSCVKARLPSTGSASPSPTSRRRAFRSP